MSIRKHFDPVELRGDIEREIVDVLDAVAMHLGTSRIELAEQILKEWCDKKVHEATLVVRVANPKGSRRSCGGATAE